MSDHATIEPDEPVPKPTPNTAPATEIAVEGLAPERTWAQRLKELSHPVALLFYMFFRIAPIFVYLFGNLLLSIFVSKNRFILHFILLILLVSADFWNLKNVSGRLLVGLRWWNETTAGEAHSYENVWVFELAPPERYINPIDSKVFWTLLYSQPAAWAVLGIMAVLKFELFYLVLIVISVSLSLTNAMAFTKCDKFSKANSLATNIFSATASTFMKRFNPFAWTQSGR